jgi:hypothetical protein
MAGNPGMKNLSVLAVALATDLDNLTGPQGHASLALINDDATAVVTVTLDGQVMTLPPNTQLKVTGTGNSKILSLTSTVNPTALRLMTSPSKVPPEFLQPNGGLVATANIVNGAVTEAKLQAAGTLDVLGVERTFTVDFDTADLDANGVSNLTAAAHPIAGFTLPDNAIVTWAAYEVVTTFQSPTGPDDATIGIGVETDDATGIKAAVAINVATNYDTGFRGTALTPATATGVALGTVKTAAAGRHVLVTIGVEAVTAGRMVIHGRYVIGV